MSRDAQHLQKKAPSVGVAAAVVKLNGDEDGKRWPQFEILTGHGRDISGETHPTSQTLCPPLHLGTGEGEGTTDDHVAVGAGDSSPAVEDVSAFAALEEETSRYSSSHRIQKMLSFTQGTLFLCNQLPHF